MNLRMRALRKFPGPYRGQVLNQGDEFTAASAHDAKVFCQIGHAAPLIESGQYTTRVMTAAPPAPPGLEAMGLEAMGLDALRALAQRLGLRVHHKAGAHKLREAIREAQAEA
jgi:hypothetical protein